MLDQFISKHTRTLAINAEITIDLGEKTLLFALQRFLAKRGQSKLVISNNIETERIKVFLHNNNIKWKFILKYAPW